MKRIRRKIIAVCTVIAVILAAKAALTAEIPVVYAENGSDIDDTAVLEEDGEDEQDTELPSSGDGENEDGEDGDGDTGKTNSGVNSGTDSAVDSETDGGNKTDSKPDADADDAEADSDADGKTEDDILADAEEGLEETLPLAGMRSVFSLRSSRSTETEVSSEAELLAALAGADNPNVNIKLTNDIAISPEWELIQFSSGDVTINLNGHTISANSGVFDVGNSGALTITGGGTIECESNSAITVQNGGTVTISNATVEGNPYGIEAYDGIVTINSGTVTGNRAACYISGGESVSRTLTINGGTFKATSGQSLYYAASKKATINGGTFTNGVGVELSKSSESIDSLSIGEWATRFYTKINGSFDNNTFRAMDTDSGYYYYIESSTGGKSGTWDGKYKEYRLLEPGKKYSFKDAGCKVSGDDSVYKACDFYFSGEGFYTFTKE